MEEEPRKNLEFGLCWTQRSRYINVSRSYSETFVTKDEERKEFAGFV